MNNHTHTHNHSHNTSEKNILTAFLLNLFFAILEIFGGLYTGSTAILSDAVHDFGDSLALGLSYIFEKIGKKQPTKDYTYGYKRLSVIGAIINIVILTLGTLFVLQEAILRFIYPKPVLSSGMLVLAIIGIAINGISAFRMKGSQKILDKTVMMHLMEDLLGWVAVFIVSIIIYFTNFYILDPILSLIICVIIGRNIYFNLVTTIHIIMQAVPDEALLEHISQHLNTTFLEISDINSINFWTLDGEEHVMSISITAKKDTDCCLLTKNIKELLYNEGIAHTTIEVLY